MEFALKSNYVLDYIYAKKFRRFMHKILEENFKCLPTTVNLLAPLYDLIRCSLDNSTEHCCEKYWSNLTNTHSNYTSLNHTMI